MIFDEDEMANRQKRIMEYQPADRDPSEINKVIPLPPYVKRVEELKCGGVRWVYEQWHADECGIKTLCFDKHSRGMPDPDEIKEDSKNKRDGKKDFGNNSRTDDVIVDLSKKLSRTLEMQEEYRVDKMLEVDLKKKNPSSSLKPAKYKDEIQTIEEKFPLPDFAKMMDDEFVKDLQSDLEAKSSFEISNIEPAQEEEEEIFYAYQNKDYFIESIAPRDEFQEEVFRKVFSTNGVGHIFFNHPEKEIYIEKNYFFRCMSSLVDDRDIKRFNLDFHVGDNTGTYDGIKINELLVAMSEKNYFERLGKSSRMVFNLLFMTEGAGTYHLGWFLKMKIDAHFAIHNFLDEHAESVEIIASNPKDIAKRAKLLKGVNVTY